MAIAASLLTGTRMTTAKKGTAPPTTPIDRAKMKPPVWLLAVIISQSEKVAPAGSVPHSVRLTAGKPNVVPVKTARKGLRVRARYRGTVARGRRSADLCGG